MIQTLITSMWKCDVISTCNVKYKTCAQLWAAGWHATASQFYDQAPRYNKLHEKINLETTSYPTIFSLGNWCRLWPRRSSKKLLTVRKKFFDCPNQNSSSCEGNAWRKDAMRRKPLSCPWSVDQRLSSSDGWYSPWAVCIPGQVQGPKSLRKTILMIIIFWEMWRWGGFL
jgi:hypothetical protein